MAKKVPFRAGTWRKIVKKHIVGRLVLRLDDCEAQAKITDSMEFEVYCCQRQASELKGSGDLEAAAGDCGDLF